MGNLLDKYSQTTGVNSRIVQKYAAPTTNTLDSVLRENTNSLGRLGSVGAVPAASPSTNPLVTALKFLSRFSYGATNAAEALGRQLAGDKISNNNPIDAYVKGFQLKETPEFKQNFVDLGVSDKPFFRKQIGPVDLNLNPAGILGFAGMVLNPLDPINWLGGFGVTKGIVKGATGTEALTRAFGEQAATQIAEKLGTKATEALGAKTVGNLIGKVKDATVGIQDITTPEIDNIIALMKQGVIDTGNQATTKLPYKISKQLTQHIAPPFMKPLASFPIPGTSPLVDAASKIGGAIKGTKLGDWFGKNFSTKHVPNTVPNQVNIKNLNAIQTLENLMNDLAKNPGPETNMTLDSLKTLKDELTNYNLPTGKLNMPSWATNPQEWVSGPSNPIYDILKPYIDKNGINTALGEAAQTTTGNLDKLAPTFYSKLGQVIDTKMGKSMPVEQFHKFIAGQGITKEELKWMDLEGLTADKTVVTKQETQDWLKAHDIQMQEVTKGDITLPNSIKQKSWYHQLSNYDLNDKDLVRWAIDISEKNRGEDIYNMIVDDGVPESLASQMIQDLSQLKIKNSTKYSGYKIPGGKDYTEQLFTLPTKTKISPAEITAAKIIVKEISNEIGNLQQQLRQLAKDHNVFMGNPATFTPEYNAATKPISDKLASLGLEYGKWDNMAKGKFDGSTNYQSPHWDESNVLAHTRFDTREVNGKKILFVQEVQSDWHQAGRKTGYTNPNITTVDKARRQKLFEELKTISKNNGDFGFDSTPEAINTMVRDGNFGNWEMTDAEKAVFEEFKTLQNLEAKQSNLVPDAPFQKTWPEFVMKRILRYAAENGYDSVAWTTGKQQAERYGLSKVVDKLNYDGKLLVGYKNNTVTMEHAITPDKLADYVGQDIAKQLTDKTPIKLSVVESQRDLPQDITDMINSYNTQEAAFTIPKQIVYEVQDQFGNVYYSGEKKYVADRALSELQRQVDQGTRFANTSAELGGNGMKSFYDEMLPATMDKYIKKWGSKTEQLNMSMGDTNTELTQYLDNGDWLNGIYDVVDGTKTWKEAINNFKDQIDIIKNEEKLIKSKQDISTLANRYINQFKDVNVTGELPFKLPQDAEQQLVDFGIKNFNLPDVPNISSLQHNIPITDAMRNDILTNGQPLFKGEANPIINALNSPNIYGDLRTVFQQMFKLSNSEANNLVDDVVTVLDKFNQGLQHPESIDLGREIDKLINDASVDTSKLWQDMMYNSNQYFNMDWKALVKKTSELTGLGPEASFKVGMKMRTLMDKLYEQIPEEFRPYFTGIMHENLTMGSQMGVDPGKAGNYGFVYNYKGAPIYHPLNSALGFNDVAKDPNSIKSIMEAIDGMKTGQQLPQTLEKFMIDPSGTGNVLGQSSSHSGLIWMNPKTLSDSYNLNDTIYHEITHQAQRTVAGGNSYDYTGIDNYLETLTKDGEHIANMGNKELNNIVDGSNLSLVDKQKFRRAINHIGRDNTISDYAFNSFQQSDQKGLLEGLAEDAMLYIAHPNIYEKLLPNRATYLKDLYTKASENLLPVDEIMKATQSVSESVASHYQEGVKFIDGEISKVMKQLDDAKKDLEAASFKLQGGPQAYKEIKKGLINVFEVSNAKETDFLHQVEVLFKGTSTQDRKTIMEAIARNQPLPENLQPMADNFVKWRESIIKEYHDLGIPVKALEDYVPFIPVRKLNKSEASMMNAFYGTGEHITPENANSWLFDLDPSLQTRTTKAVSPKEVNDLLGKEWLTEDAALAMAIRGTRAIKAEQSITFMKGIVDKYGLTLEDIAANQHNVPKGYKFYSSVVEGTGKPILKEMQNIDATSSVFALPEDFAKAFNEYTGMLHDPQATNEFLKFYDKATTFYKKMAYLWNPGHIPRDTISNMFNGWLMGNNSLKSYTQAGKVLFNHLSGKEGTIMFAGKEISDKKLWEIATKYGMLDVGASLAETPKSVIKKLNGVSLEGYSNIMRTASRANDAWTRVANFLYLVNERGMKPEQAAAEVKKFLFDYFDLTSFEKKAMRRIVPFYTWMRKNMPLQVEQLFTNTKKYGQVEKTMRAINGGQINYDNQPDYINESGAVRLPGKEGKRIYAAPNLPYTDLAKLPMNMNSFGNLLASINPLIRAPFMEMPTNTQLFSGRPIETYKGEKQPIPFASIIEKLTGMNPQVNKRGLGYLINQMPVVRNLDAITNPNNPRQMPKISSFIGGPNYYTEEQVNKSSAYTQRDRIRNAIKLLQDQGVNVPTQAELKKQSRKSLADKYR